ncbi:tyrosine-type recombinase/integrase [Streptomyces sp. NPDC047966]|uniref:tyrosine-type recombinase/integrase n=1 Tax=unclassified Streptomyces TaxID=2593676 RepID=UPI00343B40FD
MREQPLPRNHETPGHNQHLRSLPNPGQFTSWLVQNGVSLYEVQHLLGHESFQTTQRYAHLQPDAHKAVLGAWERMETPLTIAA